MNKPSFLTKTTAATTLALGLASVVPAYANPNDCGQGNNAHALAYTTLQSMGFAYRDHNTTSIDPTAQWYFVLKNLQRYLSEIPMDDPSRRKVKNQLNSLEKNPSGSAHNLCTVIMGPENHCGDINFYNLGNTNVPPLAMSTKELGKIYGDVKQQCREKLQNTVPSAFAEKITGRKQ